MKLQHPSEDVEQAHLIKWCGLYRWEGRKLSEIIFAIPNGGKRHIGTAVKLKQTGVRPGVSDLFLPIPMFDGHGLFIEMKKIGGRESKEQKVFREQMIAAGYQATVCAGWRHAALEICTYLGKMEWAPL